MTTLNDLRYAIRAFTARPFFGVAIVLSLAVGIGANTAVFSILNALMLRSLPVRDPGALFQVVHSGEAGTSTSSTYGLYEYLRRNAKTIGGALQIKTGMARVVVDGQVDSIATQQVTGDYFNLLGIRPVVGNVIQPHDEPGAAPNRVAVLDHAYWLRRFGGDPAVVGRAMTIDQVPHTIIGVTPPEFFGLQVGRRIDVSVPVDGSDDTNFWQSRSLVVRLSPGVSPETAAADLNVLFQQYVDNSKMAAQIRARSFRSLDLAPAAAGLPELRARYGRPAQTMFAIASTLLLLACANLAGLFLARAAARQRDLAVCRALGASRARLARQLVSETLLIAIAGGAVGLLVAWWGIDLLVGFLPDFGMPLDLQIRPDMNVLLFTLAASALTGVGIGLAPAWLAAKVDIRDMLAAGARTLTLGAGAFKGLIVVQVALSTLLVVVAALFVASLGNLKGQHMGFVAEGVLMLTLDADGSGVEEDRLAAMHREIHQRLQAIPGVQHATFATIGPLTSNVDGKPLSIPGVTFASPDDGVVQVNTVGPGYFETFAVPIVKGRGLTAADIQSAPQVAVVSESMSRHYFPGVDPVGRRIDVGRGGTGGQIEIVGVASDVRYGSLRTPAPRMVYVPAFQRGVEEEFIFAIRTAGNPANWVRTARQEMAAVAPMIPASEVKTLVRQRDEILANERLLATLSACFGGLALILAAIGVYGVVKYSVTQRTAELGLRIALGAPRAALAWLVIRGTLLLIVLAAGVGLGAAFMTRPLVGSLLFGIEAADPWVYSATMGLLIVIGLLATAGPTLRALRIDPVETLRSY
jgi:predicted permease